MHLELNTNNQVSITLDDLMMFMRERHYFSESISEQYFLNEFLKELSLYKQSAVEFICDNKLFQTNNE